MPMPMTSPDGVTALVTWLATMVDSEESARVLAAAGVHARLAACAQVEAIQSYYWWDNALQTSAEWRITYKTTAVQRSALQKLLSSRHPYKLPQWLWGECAASPAYAAWVAGEVTAPLQV